MSMRIIGSGSKRGQAKLIDLGTLRAAFSKTRPGQSARRPGTELHSGGGISMEEADERGL